MHITRLSTSNFHSITVQAGLICTQTIHNLIAKDLEQMLHKTSIMNLCSRKVTDVFHNFPKLNLGALAMTIALESLT